MTISSSMNAGVAGLSAQSAKLGTIADNIANSQTAGYKRAAVDFAALALGAPGGSYTAGGVKANTVRHVDQKGAMITTDNATDLAVAGRGMLPVTTTTAVAQGAPYPMSLLPTGSFRPDANGVMTTASGVVLLGWPAGPDGTIPAPARNATAGLQPVVIDRSALDAQPTTQVRLGINLPADATAAGADGTPLIAPVQYYDNLGGTQTLEFSFVPAVPAEGRSNAWTLEVRDLAQGDDPIGTATLIFDDSSGAGGRLADVTPGDGLAFDADTGVLTLAVPSGEIAVAIGSPGGEQIVSQYAAAFNASGVIRDGAAAAELVGVMVDAQGFVRGTYANGSSRVLYQVPVVDVPNMNGLIPGDNQTFAVGPQSGPFYLWDAGSGPVGEMLGFTQEMSATDIAHELTQLIQTQRAYSSNARIIQTSDEMLQETTNLKR